MVNAPMPRMRLVRGSSAVRYHLVGAHTHEGVQRHQHQLALFRVPRESAHLVSHLPAAWMSEIRSRRNTIRCNTIKNHEAQEVGMPAAALAPVAPPCFRSGRHRALAWTSPASSRAAESLSCWSRKQSWSTEGPWSSMCDWPVCRVSGGNRASRRRYLAARHIPGTTAALS